MTQKKKVLRFTLELWKLYLDICATYHTAFVTWLLDDVEDVNTTMVGNYNNGVKLFSLKDYYGKFHMWINKNVMENLLSIPCLKEEGYHIDYASNKEWVVTKPQGGSDKVQRGHMPY